MCVVSNVGDSFGQRWPKYPFYEPYKPVPQIIDSATVEEVRKLRQDIEELKKALKAAKIVDQYTGNPDCEMEEKVALIKQIAEALDVDLEGIFSD